MFFKKPEVNVTQIIVTFANPPTGEVTSGDGGVSTFQTRMY